MDCFVGGSREASPLRCAIKVEHICLNDKCAFFLHFWGKYAYFKPKFPNIKKITRKSAKTGCLKFKNSRLTFLKTDLDKVLQFTLPQRDLNVDIQILDKKCRYIG